MVKKKVMKKKPVVKKVKKKTTAKKTTITKTKISSNILKNKTLKTGKLLMYSAIVFILSLVLYYANSDITLVAIFGLVAILSGALVLLGITVELILYLLKKKN